MNFFQIYSPIISLSGFWFNQVQCSRLKKSLTYLKLLASTLFAVSFAISAIVDSADFDLYDYTQISNFTIALLLMFTKNSLWLFGGRDVEDFVNAIDKKMPKFEDVNGIFKPKNIIERNSKIMKIITKIYNISGLCVPLAFCLASLKDLSLSGNNYYKYVISSSNTTAKIYNQKLPYPLFIPFNYKRSKKSFLIALFYEFVHLSITASNVIGGDILLFLLLSHPTTHLEIINGAFKTLKERCMRRSKIFLDQGQSSKALLDKEMILEMNRCIRYLQSILIFCSNIENFFTIAALVQTFSSLIFLCTCFYTVTQIDSGKEMIIGSLLYLICSEAQIFALCFLGNRITDLCLQVSTSVYEIDWTGSTIPFQKNMLITMVRMQQPIHLSAGKVLWLTLPTFVTICKTAYQVFAVIKTMED